MVATFTLSNMTVGTKSLGMRTSFPMISPTPIEINIEFTEIMIKALLSAITLRFRWFADAFLKTVSTPLR